MNADTFTIDNDERTPEQRDDILDAIAERMASDRTRYSTRIARFMFDVAAEEALDMLRRGQDVTHDDMERTVWESLDGMLIYSNTIEDAWKEYGRPEPEQLGDTIESSMILAIHECIASEDIPSDILIGLQEALTDWEQD